MLREKNGLTLTLTSLATLYMKRKLFKLASTLKILKILKNSLIKMSRVGKNGVINYLQGRH